MRMTVQTGGDQEFSGVSPVEPEKSSRIEWRHLRAPAVFTRKLPGKEILVSACSATLSNSMGPSERNQPGFPPVSLAKPIAEQPNFEASDALCKGTWQPKPGNIAASVSPFNSF